MIFQPMFLKSLREERERERVESASAASLLKSKGRESAFPAQPNIMDGFFSSVAFPHRFS